MGQLVSKRHSGHSECQDIERLQFPLPGDGEPAFPNDAYNRSQGACVDESTSSILTCHEQQIYISKILLAKRPAVDQNENSGRTEMVALGGRTLGCFFQDADAFSVIKVGIH